MGYDTYMEIGTIKQPWEEYQETAAIEIDENFERLSDVADEPFRWYDVGDCMKQLSARFPEETFILVGHGENQTDIWRSVYQGGEEYGGQTVMYFPEVKLPDGSVVPQEDIA